MKLFPRERESTQLSGAATGHRVMRGEALESRQAASTVSLSGRETDRFAEIALLLWGHFLHLVFVLSRSGSALPGCLVMDMALLLEAEELKMSQDHEVILADHRELEPGIVTGLRGRRCGSQGPGTSRGSI